MKKILIVEDNLILLNLLKDKIQKAGYDVIVEKNGFAGLMTAKKEIPDLILLDIMLPEMDGPTVLKKLREEETVKQIPVIIISNSGDSPEIEEIKKLGANDFLVKTEFEPAEVIVKINEFFEKEGIAGDKNAFSGASGLGQNSTSASPSKETIISAKEETLIQGSADLAVPITGSENTILIIEDDKFLRDLISKKIQKERMEVMLAITAEGALKILKEKKAELILLDLILPGMNGFEFLKLLKQDQKTASIPVIILSNLGEDKDKETALKLGAKGFLVKAEHTPNEIVEEIKKILRETYV